MNKRKKIENLRCENVKNRREEVKTGSKKVGWGVWCGGGVGVGVLGEREG